MMEKGEILARVLGAQGKPQLAEEIIADYMPFIKSETYKAIGHLPVEGVDDTLSIAMFAFYEAIENYSKLRGTFLAYAALHIKHRIIDFQRKEKRHSTNVSMDQPVFGEEDERKLSDTLKEETDEYAEKIQRSATQQELMELGEQLASYGLSLADIATHCPKQERTLAACMKALGCAKENPELIETLVKTGKLPLAELTSLAKVERKTLERHRKYVMALMLIYSNGYEIIRGHLKQVGRKGGGVQ